MIGCEGKKFDNQKPKMGMVFNHFKKALLEVGKTGTYGNKKYSPDEYWDYNWEQLDNGYERYTDALVRHLLQEGADSESGLPHAAHVAWNALARLEILLRK